MNTNGKKEIIEQVIIASLVAFCTGMIGWGLESVRDLLKDDGPEPKKTEKEIKTCGNCCCKKSSDVKCEPKPKEDNKS